MRGVNLLSDKAIKAAIKLAATSAKAVTVNDGGGLTLEAQPTGDGGGYAIGCLARQLG